MAYSSPYNDPYITQHRRPTDPGSQQPAAPAQYSDENFFNPYENSNPYPTYDQSGPPAGAGGYGNYGGGGGYPAAQPQGVPQRYPTTGGRSQRTQPSMDDSRNQYGAGGGYPDQPKRNPTQRSQPSQLSQTEKTKEIGSGGDEYGMGGAIPRQQKTARTLRQYRTDDHLWKQSGGGGCIGRFLGCGVLMFLLIVPSILLTFALFIRPPNIIIGAVDPGAKQIQRSAAGLNITMSVDISVSNPNYFGVSFSGINADIIYPINDVDIGGGKSGVVAFPSRAQTNFTFPFYIDYQTANDPGDKIILDLATKCGVLGSSKSNIIVNYRLTLGLKILFFTISPVIANQFSFPCPLSQSDLQGLVGI